MNGLILPIILSFVLDFSGDDLSFRSIEEHLRPYRSFSVEERELFCRGGDRLSCRMLAVERLLGEGSAIEDLYGELSGARREDAEFTPRILVGPEAELTRSIAIYLLIANRSRELDPGMIGDLLRDLGEPYFSRLHPLYLRRLADAGRMAEFMREYRPVSDESIIRIHLLELLKKDAEAAFDFIKSIATPLSERFEDEVNELFTAAWAGRKEVRKDYLLWQMYVNYRAFRYDRCLRIGKSFPATAAVKELVEWRAELLRAMALTRMRKHTDAVTIYQELAPHIDRLAPSEDDLHNYFRWGGFSLGAIGRNAEAIAHYLKGYERLIASDSADSFLYYAADLERLTENWTAAERLYGELIDRYPGSSHRALAEFLVFWIRYSDNRYEEALASLRHITLSSLRNGYDSVRARYWIGRIEEKRGNHTEAITLFSDIAREQPLSYYGALAASRLRTKGVSGDAPAPPPPISFSPGHRLMPELEWVAALLLTGYLPQSITLLAANSRKIVDAGTVEDRFFATHLAQAAGHFGLSGTFVRSLSAVADFSAEVARMQYPIGFETEIVPHAVLYEVSPLFVFSIARQESQFDAKVVSVSNAVGLLQLLQGTAQLLANQENYGGKVSTDLLKRPFTNARFGIKFLSNLLKRYRGNMALAAAAYNAGPGRVDRWLERMGTMELDELVENIPIFQTRNYVKKVLANYAAYRFLYEGKVEDGIEFTLPVRQ